MQTYYAIGLMSGSSLDGLDIAYCRFDYTDKWSFEILKADCVAYSACWIEKLKSAVGLNAVQLVELHTAYGHYLGETVSKFIQQNNIQQVDLIASHGHTVFHYPAKKFTCQIGDGAAIAAITGIKTVSDLRAVDIALGGQGAPIVPIGDKLLFAAYKYCLNIGGIANISCKSNGAILAYDVCAANQVLNYYASQVGLEYDKGGELAAQGKVDGELLAKLNALQFHHQRYPKSLDNSFSKNEVLPLIEQYQLTVNDKLCTYVEVIAQQVTAQINVGGDLLITGGGAFNAFLIERIKANVQCDLTVPSADIVNYKEALVMALIGVLRLREEVNVLSSVTGAREDSINGALYLPFK